MNPKLQQLPFLTPEEMRRHGCEQADFVLVSGDAYVDHPSFGAAIIARVLMDRGFWVAVLAQPEWNTAEAFRCFGEPRLAFLVTAGNLDSMVNHYTAAKRPRSDDAYTPGGRAGRRPDRAAIVYANRCREAYRHVPVILGGIEASLRRFAHYDYWSDRVRHSILYDAGADLLVYGMGEKAITQIARRLDLGDGIDAITDVPGTCWRTSDPSGPAGAVLLPSYTQVAEDKLSYAKAFVMESAEQDAVRGRILVQPHEKGALVANPPAPPLTTEELDAVYALPFTRKAHPYYKEKIPALDEVSFSVTSVRGCYGGCSFCALTFHQGRVVQPRSHDSILSEIRRLTHDPDFRGYIHDVGGPTADFRQPACSKQLNNGVCPDKQCIGFAPCKNLVADHSDYVALLRKCRSVPGVKKVFVRSGVRYDYMLYDRSDAFFRELLKHHVSGQLKVAPEHVSDRVLYYMNKPPHALFERFSQKYADLNRSLGRDQYLVPYLISSHPGSQLSDAIELAQYLKSHRIRPEQVQDFYPTPGTLSTCMYYTGIDPRTMQPVYIPRTPQEKAMQRALLQFTQPRNFAAVRKALETAGREDLIGTGKDCLVPPERTVQRQGGAPKRAQKGTKNAAGGKNNRKTHPEKPASRPKTKRAVDKRGRFR